MTAHRNVTAVSVMAVHVPVVAVSALSATAVSCFTVFLVLTGIALFLYYQNPQCSISHHLDGLLFE